MKDQKGDDTTPFVYKDFSKVSEDSIPALKKKFGSNETSELHFPVRLHYMLNEMEKDGQSKIISWQPHGRCFCIHDTALLEHSALPLWFRQTKYASFQRQLNIYGFCRITDGYDQNCYYHEMFLRGKQFLAHFIDRKGGKRKHKDAHQVNLRALPSLPATNPKSTAPSTPLKNKYQVPQTEIPFSHPPVFHQHLATNDPYSSFMLKHPSEGLMGFNRVVSPPLALPPSCDFRFSSTGEAPPRSILMPMGPLSRTPSPPTDSLVLRRHQSLTPRTPPARRVSMDHAAALGGHSVLRAPPSPVPRGLALLSSVGSNAAPVAQRNKARPVVQQPLVVPQQQYAVYYPC